MEIIPAIIAKDFEDLKAKIKLVEPHVKSVQLDIMDGVFVPNQTWPFVVPSDDGTPQGKPSISELDKLNTKLYLEAHLMIEKPQEVTEEWLESKVKRVILHWETLEKIHSHEMTPYKTSSGPGFPVIDLTEEAHKHNKEFGVAINPDTPISVLDSFINDIDLVLLMGVNPGFAGQKFIGKVIPKISSLRAKYPSVKIEVDGGINISNAKKITQAGADILVAGSTIFESGDVAEVIEELKKSV